MIRPSAFAHRTTFATAAGGTIIGSLLLTVQGA